MILSQILYLRTKHLEKIENTIKLSCKTNSLFFIRIIIFFALFPFKKQHNNKKIKQKFMDHVYGNKVEGKKIWINSTMKSFTCKSGKLFSIHKFDVFKFPNAYFGLTIFFSLGMNILDFSTDKIDVRRNINNNWFIIFWFFEEIIKIKSSCLLLFQSKCNYWFLKHQ